MLFLLQLETPVPIMETLTFRLHYIPEKLITLHADEWVSFAGHHFIRDTKNSRGYWLLSAIKIIWNPIFAPYPFFATLLAKIETLVHSSIVANGEGFGCHGNHFVYILLNLWAWRVRGRSVKIKMKYCDRKSVISNCWINKAFCWVTNKWEWITNIWLYDQAQIPKENIHNTSATSEDKHVDWWRLPARQVCVEKRRNQSTLFKKWQRLLPRTMFKHIGRPPLKKLTKYQSAEWAICEDWTSVQP